ncbi:MAG: toprim domain-containing protein [Nitrososphaera sp.]|nr:toprim domain-containing protein [Nitrososphaera sp.]
MNIETLKELANQNITKIFDAFGIEYTDRYDYYQGKCPIHGGDNPTAFSWKKDRGFFRCFTHRCERDGADIFDFVSKFKKCNFVESVKIVRSIVAGSYSEDDDAKMMDEIAFQKYIKNNAPRRRVCQPIDPSKLKALKPDTYLIGRGFSQAVIDDYRIGYSSNPDSYYYRRTCIPVCDDSGIIVGITARATFDFETEGLAKWIHTSGMPKSEVLFNLNNAKKHILKTHQAILVEGPLDVLKFEMAGIHNSVAVLGSSLSGKQRSLLLENECFDLILAFDADEAGRICANEVKQTCNRYFALYEYHITTGKDIGDLSVEEIQKLDYTKVNE